MEYKTYAFHLVKNVPFFIQSSRLKLCRENIAKNVFGLPSLLKFISYLDLDFAGEFFVYAKIPRDDVSTVLTKKKSPLPAPVTESL